MNPRAAVTPVLAAAIALVAVMGGSSPAARDDGRTGSLDLLSSAHPTPATPHLADRAFDTLSRVRGSTLAVDGAALTSATCDGCAGESTTLQVVYASRARRARLDNVASAWSQECTGCTGTALSVQVVVLRGQPTTRPTNRALALNAACTGCRTSAAAFQVVLVADDAAPLGPGELADLRAWVAEQEAVLRASVTGPLPEPPPTSPTPTPTPTPTTSATPQPTPTSELTAAPTASPTRPEPTIAPPDPTVVRSERRARRDATGALGELEALLTRALDAEAVAADVEVSR